MLILWVLIMKKVKILFVFVVFFIFQKSFLFCRLGIVFQSLPKALFNKSLQGDFIIKPVNGFFSRLIEFNSVGSNKFLDGWNKFLYGDSRSLGVDNSTIVSLSNKVESNKDFFLKIVYKLKNFFHKSRVKFNCSFKKAKSSVYSNFQRSYFEKTASLNKIHLEDCNGLMGGQSRDIIKNTIVNNNNKIGYFKKIFSFVSDDIKYNSKIFSSFSEKVSIKFSSTFEKAFIWLKSFFESMGIKYEYCNINKLGDGSVLFFGNNLKIFNNSRFFCFRVSGKNGGVLDKDKARKVFKESVFSFYSNLKDSSSKIKEFVNKFFHKIKAEEKLKEEKESLFIRFFGEYSKKFLKESASVPFASGFYNNFFYRKKSVAVFDALVGAFLLDAFLNTKNESVNGFKKFFCQDVLGNGLFAFATGASGYHLYNNYKNYNDILLKCKLFQDKFIAFLSSKPSFVDVLKWKFNFASSFVNKSFDLSISIFEKLNKFNCFKTISPYVIDYLKKNRKPFFYNSGSLFGFCCKNATVLGVGGLACEALSKFHCLGVGLNPLLSDFIVWKVIPSRKLN